MIMKNSTAIELSENGVMDLTGHTLDIEYAKKLILFRESFVKILKNISSMEVTIMSECGIESPQDFDQEKKELEENPYRSAAETETLEYMKSQVKNFIERRSVILEQEQELDGLPVLPFEQWKKLAIENKVSAKVEDLLRGILWDFI